MMESPTSLAVDDAKDEQTKATCADAPLTTRTQPDVQTIDGQLNRSHGSRSHDAMTGGDEMSTDKRELTVVQRALCVIPDPRFNMMRQVRLLRICGVACVTPTLCRTLPHATRAIQASLHQSSVASFHSSSFDLAASCSSPSPPASSAPFELESSLANLGSLFADARLDIEDSLESVGTTYYPADIQQAIDSVNNTLLLFDSIQSELGASSAQATKLRESWGMRLEQLKQELQQAIEQGGGEEH
jgi:hypothetical protein